MKKCLCLFSYFFGALFIVTSYSFAEETNPAAELDGVRWNFPSADKFENSLKKGATCTSALVKGDPKTTDNFTLEKKFGGKPGTNYKVTLRFRGVVEPMMYKNGKQEGDYFYIGGEPNNSTYNIYKLSVSSPASHYYLNRQDKVGHLIFSMDYTTTIEINGGATLTISGDGQNGKMIANFESLTVAGIEDKPFNGQFVHVSVVKVEEVSK